MDSVKAQPDVLGVLLAMAGGMAIACPIILRLIIDYDKLFSKPLVLLVMLMAASSLGKVILRFTSTSARITAIMGIVAGWYLVYGTLFSHFLRF
jgi:lipopolysaccharide export LptBFGC system permease protein LptF